MSYSVQFRATDPTFHSWASMRINCNAKPGSKSFSDYVARGITVCERWNHSFEAFLQDMGKRPEGAVLIRKNTSLGYTPENCIWGVRSQITKRRNYTPIQAALRTLFSNQRSKAAARGLEWKISLDDFLFLCKQDCHYCGKPPRQSKQGYEAVIAYNGLDRKDNSKGYIFENVLPCCKQCNVAKNIYTYDEFLEWVGRIFHNHGVRCETS